MCERVNNFSFIDHDDGNYHYLPEPTDEFCKDDLDVRTVPQKAMTEQMVNFSSFNFLNDLSSVNQS
jgi:hypothetical protein